MAGKSLSGTHGSGEVVALLQIVEARAVWLPSEQERSANFGMMAFHPRGGISDEGEVCVARETVKPKPLKLLERALLHLCHITVASEARLRYPLGMDARSEIGGAGFGAVELKGRVRHVSLSERAYNEIKQLILQLKLKPGEYVNEARLAEALQIGRTPVNRAMQRLSFEGLVQVVPRKGIVVQPLSLDQVVDLIEARRLNEPYCAGLAARRITPAEIAELKDIIKQTKQSVSRRDVEALMDFDRQFHRLIAAAARNGVILELLMQIHDRSQRFWAFSLSDVDHLDEVLVEHEKIVAALEQGDSAAAEEVMRAHIDSFRATMERTIR